MIRQYVFKKYVIIIDKKISCRIKNHNSIKGKLAKRQRYEKIRETVKNRPQRRRKKKKIFKEIAFLVSPSTIIFRQ